MSRDLEDEEELAMGRSEKTVPGRGNSMGKDFEARPCLVCSESSREVGVAGTVRGDRGREIAGTKPQGCYCTGPNKR